MPAEIIAIAVEILLILAPQAVQASGCVLQLANGDPHSSTSRHLQVNLENGIATSRYLALTDTVGRYDFESYLVRAPANDITRYRKDRSFRAFYVITEWDRSGCCFIQSTNGRITGLVPNNSWKPTPPRNAA